MMSPEHRTRLTMAVTDYDRKQQGKAGYNIYALPQYLGAVHRAEDEVADGATIRAALLRCFTGRLLTVTLKAVGEPAATDEERRTRDAQFFREVFG